MSHQHKSISTVVEAYRLLEDQGVLEALRLKSIEIPDPPLREGDRRRVNIQLESVERGLSTLIVGALLGHGVLAVFIFMTAAMIGIALVVGLYGPKTNALALEEISV